MTQTNYLTLLQLMILGECVMPTRLILCFDGTWNSPASKPNDPESLETNVVRLYEAVWEGATPDSAVQKKWYDAGVGTNWYDKLSGGVAGFGIDQKIQDGYQFLVDAYPDPDPGDYEIYITGFSRGAYTARSLVGMIRNVGLLRPANVHRVSDAYALYRKRDASADTSEAQDFRNRYSRLVEIKFLGVWDTVGALGIPLPALQWLNAAEYAFHDTELSSIVKNAAHAVAIDEHRVDYQVTLWDPVPKTGQSVEQRWFAGAHADVGGGYTSRSLSDITLAWMQAKARAVGLVIDPTEIPTVTPANHMAPVTDSYNQFLGGAYALTHKPYFRPLSLGPSSNEIFDQSAADKRRDDPAYRPTNAGLP